MLGSPRQFLEAWPARTCSAPVRSAEGAVTRHQDRKRCRKYYKANAEAIKAKRRARYRSKVLGKDQPT